MTDDEAPPFDASRAELFEALSHPLRVRILQVLGDSPQRFSELKHTLGIESSGHLAFHLDKLENLVVTTTVDGTYRLSDEGKDALQFLVGLNQVTSGPDVHQYPRASLFTKKRIIVVSVCIAIIVLLPFAVIGINLLLQPCIVQGVVLNKSVTYTLRDEDQYEQWAVVVLRLITPDPIRGRHTGDIHTYLFPGNAYDRINIGDLVEGVHDHSNSDSLTLLGITSFLTPPIINTGYTVHSQIEFYEAGSLPWLHVRLLNLGNQSITTVRVTVNSTSIPFSLGFSSESPIAPSYEREGTAPIRWFDAQVNDIVGFTPLAGETYCSQLTVQFDDGTTLTHDLSLTARNVGAIGLLVDPGSHIEVSADLFQKRGDTGVFSLWIRNVWFQKVISRITVFLDDVLVMQTSTNLTAGAYWAGSGTLPYPVWTHRTYNATVQVETSDGDLHAVSRLMSAEDF